MAISKLIRAFFEMYRPKSNNLYIAPLLAAGLISAGGKVLGGLMQRRQAKKLKQSNYIPPALTEAKAEADIIANSSTAPGQQAEEEAARQSTAQSITNASKVAGSANELINFAGAARGNENKNMRDIARRALIWKDSQRANRNMIRGRIASQQAANRDQYQGAKSALIGASNQNIFGGITDAATAFALGSVGGGKTPIPRNPNYVPNYQ